MAVQQNNLTEIGDVLLIYPTLPLTRVVSVDSFVDDVSNEDVQRFFTKEFRWSSNGFIWSDWIALTNGNLSALSVSSYNPFYIQYRYTRAGTDDTSYIAFNSITLNVTTLDNTVCDPVFTSSVFGEFFTCCCSAEFLPWCTSVLEKLYQQGIVPKYVDRVLETGEINEEYIQFWRSVACYFSLYVNYVRVFEEFYDREVLLRMYLEMYNVFLCGDETLEQLQTIARNLYGFIQYRGTKIPAQYDFHPNNIMGEILRLLCYNVDTDENFFVPTPDSAWGWIVGATSPMYRSVYKLNHFSKAYEDSFVISDINAYPLYGAGHSLSNGVLSIPASAGIGIIDPLVEDLSSAIVVDPSLDYILNIELEMSAISPHLSVGFIALDENGDEVQPYNIITQVQTKWAFQNQTVNIASQLYSIRAILYNSDQDVLSSADGTLNVGFGVALRMHPSTVKIIPILMNEAGSSALVDVSRYHFSLLRTPYGRAFINASGRIEAILKNNSSQWKNSEINLILRRYFTPYNAALISTYL